MNKFIIAGFTMVTLTGCQSIDSSPARLLNPVEECRMVDVPIYGMVDRPASDSEVFGGAIIGGILGNQLGDGNGKTALTALGAIAGANTAGQRKTEQVVIGYSEERRCATVYK